MNEKAIQDYLAAVDPDHIVAELKKGTKALEIAERARSGLVAAEAGQKAQAAGSTRFEELESVGFYAQERRLEAVISLNQRFGYGGGPGSVGSYEYVGLYVNWNQDGDFNDTGEDVGVANVHVFDSGHPNDAKKLPIHYAVYRDLTPLPPLPPNSLVKVRAILSWQQPPTGPNFKPTWGNVIDRWIRIDNVE
jgi:hypothetical protein